MPNASKLLHKFSGGSSKRIYIILKGASGDHEDGGTDISKLVQFLFAHRPSRLLLCL